MALKTGLNDEEIKIRRIRHNDDLMGEDYNRTVWEPSSVEEKRRIYTKLTISDRDHWHACNLAYEYHGEMTPQDVWDSQPN